jgi:hypothetical protein
MSRVRHDQFAKDILAEFLDPFGEVRIDHNIPAEPRRADVLFIPKDTGLERPEAFGIFRRLAGGSALFEAYRKPIDDDDVVGCMGKLCWAHQEARRDQRRSGTRLEGAQRLWVISPSCARDRLAGFGFAPGEAESWPAGLFFLAPRWRYGLVVVDQLPETPETLGLRLLGRGRVQARAIQEVLDLPEVHPLRKNLFQIMLDWRILFEERPPATEEDQELSSLLFRTVEEFDQARREAREAQQRAEEDRQRLPVIGQVRLLEELLELPPTDPALLDSLSLEDLEKMRLELRARLRS